MSTMCIYTYVSLCFFFFFFYFRPSLSLSPDGFSLLAVKSSIISDPTRVLSSWAESDSYPCEWAGITCDPTLHVTSISLSGKSLSGYIPSEIGALTYLLSLDLSHNNLSGTLPDQVKNLQNLSRLDLSSNSLTGFLPETLVNLTRLAGTLNLSFNFFSGEVPRSFGNFPVTLSLDLRNNNLSGKIPQIGSLLNQGPTAFSGNLNLCGFPLNSKCPEPEAQNPRIYRGTENPREPDSSSGFAIKEKARNGSVSVLAISGVSVVVGVLVLSVWALRKKLGNNEGKLGKKKGLDMEEGNEVGQKGKFVILDEGFGLELEDLLRASAYVVGKSKGGIVYKVVVGKRRVVAVRRLSEGEDDDTWRLKEFEAEVEAIGRVQHPNIVRLRAYYYADDEKLLISDFIGNGSLFTALHGGNGNTLPPLSWDLRLKIARGIARGLAHIHECTPKKLVHKSIKSSKILFDDEIHPYISGFGITRLVLETSKSTNAASKKQNQSDIYVAPEVRGLGTKFTQKCDVYSFGIILMEILTGRLPDEGIENDGKTLENYVRKVFREKKPLSEIIDPVLLNEVRAKKQVITVFHIALNCTELDPEIRPRMRVVCDSLDRVGSQ